MHVLSTTGLQAETHLPFAGLLQLLGPIVDGIDHLPPPQRDALRAAFGVIDAPAPNRFLLALGTLNLLTDAGADPGLVALAEDAQWLDAGTGDVLAFVARRLGTDPVSLVVAVRGGFEGPLVDAGLPEMRLDGLDDIAASQLIDDVAPGLTPTVRDRLLREAEGNPLAIAELPAALAAEQAAGVAPLPELLPLTARLERAFAARLDELPPGTNEQLLIAALNDSANVDEVLSASAVIGGATDGVRALEGAAAAGLVDLDAVEVRFRHPLVRSAVAQAASDVDRRAVHAALAQALRDHPDRCAWHRAAATVGSTTRSRLSSRPPPSAPSDAGDLDGGLGPRTSGHALGRRARARAAADASRRAHVRARSAKINCSDSCSMPSSWNSESSNEGG